MKKIKRDGVNWNEEKKMYCPKKKVIYESC